MLKDLIMNTIFQWVIFLLIPMLVYLIFFRKKYKFLSFLGLIKPEKDKESLLIITSIISIIYLVLNVVWLKKYNLGMDDIRLVSFQQTGFSIQTILIICIHSIIRTSFLEEIVFRGFLINSFKDKLRFNIANQIQALLFTGIHILGTFNVVNIVDLVMGTIMIYILSIYFGKLAKESGYSIFYSAIFHGLINIITAILLVLIS